jgi:hypothetical protein
MLYVLPHRVPADPQPPGNMPLTQTLALQYQYVRNGLLFFNAPPRSC